VAIDKYKEVTAIPKFTPSPAYAADVRSAGMGGDQVHIDFPKNTPDAILAERARWSSTEMTGQGALQAMRALREAGRTNILSRDAEKIALGRTQLDISKALEKEIGVQADKSGKPDLIKQFKNARKELARLHALQDSMVGTKFSPRALGKAYDNGTPLDGNLKLIAENANAHRNVFKDVHVKGQQGAYTVHDAWVATLGLGMGGGYEVGVGHTGPGAGMLGLAAYTAARPAVRKLLTSKPAQKLMTRPAKARYAERYLKHQTPRAAALGAESLAQSPDLGEGGQ
jgi:hypothetical protein